MRRRLCRPPLGIRRGLLCADQLKYGKVFDTSARIQTIYPAGKKRASTDWVYCYSTKTYPRICIHVYVSTRLTAKYLYRVDWDQLYAPLTILLFIANALHLPQGIDTCTDKLCWLTEWIKTAGNTSG